MNRRKREKKMIYQINYSGRRLEPINAEDKNNLAIGTILKLNGYDNPRFVITDKLGINERFPMYGMRYIIVNLETLVQGVKDAYELKWISEKKDDRIQTYILDETIPADEVKVIYEKAVAKKEEKDRLQKQVAEEHTHKIELGKQLFEQGKPDYAKAVIIASREIDDCELMTDYFNTKEDPFFIIGWSKHTKDLFSEMRKAAILSGMPELSHFSEITPEDEHREKYSLGAGYYLKRGHRYDTAWKVTKQSLSYSLESVYLAFAEGRVKLGEAK
jgi:hypothetical protein